MPLQHTALYSGFYVNELLIRVVEKSTPFPQLFQDYLTCLTTLAISQNQVEPALRIFELKLLKTLGYGIDFLHCAGSGASIDPEMTYQYRAEKGFFASLIENQYTFTGQDLLAFAQLNFNANTLKSAKRFTRLALKPYLGSQPLKSRELFIIHKGNDA